jgi:2-succinyl-5-enolpyruvyl-6-hydroxy-3-cyclohexene-1-carboxylate synthase
MPPDTDNHLLLRAFVDELVRCGMRAACTSPGSRNAPLVLSLARERRLRCYSHIDERAAGFFALGLAKASGLPVAVACTSGTAVAELLPAAIEAHEARVPLLILSADRPPELRETGAGQTIDQLKLFGSAAKWFFEVGTQEASEGRLRWIRTLACRAYATSLEGRPGVVHLNFPLREPLVFDGALPEDSSGRPDGAPYLLRPAARASSAEQTSLLRELVAGARRGVVVAGRDERTGEADPPSAALAASDFCAAAGWPLLADPLSGARRGPAAVAHYDAILRDEATAQALRPDLIVRIGDLPVSKPLRSWLAGLGDVPQVALDPEGAWQDPSSVLWRSLALDPALALQRLGGLFTQGESHPSYDEGAAPEPGEHHLALTAADEDWLSGWRAADELAAEAIGRALAGRPISEPAVAAELGVLLAQEATLFVASSMPVREIETFWPVRSDPPRVLCNRGANGIDGTVSSAFGAAAGGSGPVVLLIGDVALAHDIGGLVAARRLGLKLTIVLIENGGGGIFDFLAVSRAPIALEDDIYERHIATAPGLEFAGAAALFGLAHERVGDVRGLRSALERALADERSWLIEVNTERAANVALHASIWEAVRGALSPPAAGAGPSA